MCEYCEKIETIKDKWFYFDPRDNFSREYAEPMKINYCPMCRKKVERS